MNHTIEREGNFYLLNNSLMCLWRDRERSPPRGRDRERYDGGRHSRDSSRNSGREVFATPKRVASRDPWGNSGNNGGYTPTGAGNGGFRNFGGWDDGYGTPQVGTYSRHMARIIDIFHRIIVDDVMIEEIIMTVVILSHNVIIGDGEIAGHLITDCEINTASIKNW